MNKQELLDKILKNYKPAEINYEKIGNNALFKYKYKLNDYQIVKNIEDLKYNDYVKFVDINLRNISKTFLYKHMAIIDYKDNEPVYSSSILSLENRKYKNEITINFYNHIFFRKLNKTISKKHNFLL
jgi:hypothetical protein